MAKRATHIPVYLDNAATTPVDPRVVEAMLPYFTDRFYNPSSFYGPAQEVHDALDEARAYLASTIGASARAVRFTSGGTEADNAALKGLALANAARGRHVVISAIEHPAVSESARWLERQGFEVERVPVDGEGIVSPEALSACLRADTCLVSVMMANNEIGTIEPIAALAARAHAAGALFHTDAVQAYGHIPVDVRALDVDALSVSAHKLAGPKGAGFLYCRRGVACEPVAHGGAQERGYRAGTENVPAIIGFAAAARLAFGGAAAGTTAWQLLEERSERIGRLRDRLVEQVVRAVPDVCVSGPADPARRLAGHAHLCFKGISSEALLMRLDKAGVLASAGSACASGSLEPSPVLQAIGVEPDWIGGALRLTLSAATTEADIAYAAAQLIAIVRDLRARQ